ncbi:phosphohistidine phosphatase SixA [Prodigiosinella confusarubida]|uniref:Phosphohistidine phosphatase SixA n=1 Tax=Serratia sp. (strain ATCC 39006) TaxID=104623 RepID=A0A2I5TIT0_SERS3|nr:MULTISPECIES: phosphohistidine phosphatase SixA [Enterobacterales]WJV56931.1 phosphohistidine phosphatase SixA [Pectobacteriaceae bacterium C111]WJY16400.1 phosphohistidine phosphatase SixA [Pectobacteriaceae bacterium CE90]AUH00141.1 phosphohistidine phosphatase SixA [Serratia sp. ATCC 39006]AUH04460.1 phosphohistidine phosphatase SixA [Serratia sp. ATCC 39006]WJV52577.1 phosphohistidine phosphatase SixA [Prodigiosinella sp. LS101]
MQVLIMRHGDAVPDAASDALRPLSARGCNETHQMAAWLNNQAIDIDRVLVSPYLRARQTLQAVRSTLPLPEEDECLPELTPGGDAKLISYYLQTLAKEGTGGVLIISHLPLVGYLVASLCPGETAPMFATSAVACVNLEAESGVGECHWQVSPSQLTIKASS